MNKSSELKTAWPYLPNSVSPLVYAAIFQEFRERLSPLWCISEALCPLVFIIGEATENLIDIGEVILNVARAGPMVRTLKPHKVFLLGKPQVRR